MLIADAPPMPVVLDMNLLQDDGMKTDQRSSSSEINVSDSKQTNPTKQKDFMWIINNDDEDEDGEDDEDSGSGLG